MKYATGLVVGKFCPLHKGHELLISTALSQCNRVVILSYTSQEFEGYEVEKREQWIKLMYPKAIVKVLSPHEVPDDDAPAEFHRLFCADHLLNVMNTTVQAVFTSEDYGDGFAEYLSKYFSENLSTEITVDHVLVDKERIQFPVSGTYIRESIANGNIPVTLHPYVFRDFVKRVAFLGGESSGKTTLTTALGRRTNIQWVLEYGRELYDDRTGKLNYEDMEFIAKTQIGRENRSRQEQYMFCDTTPLTTKFYSEQLFNRVSPALEKMSQREYYKIYLCSPDINFEQDGTRRDSTFRTVGHNWYVKYLTAHNIPYTIVQGSLEERIDFVMKDLGL